MKTRMDVINFLIEKNNYKSYLEIGVQQGVSFNAINVPYKVGVDPDERSVADLKLSSNEFFIQNKELFDIIFIDGLHHWDQALVDFHNALKCLSLNGTIVMHDCNPESEAMQHVPRINKQWTGDVWKAFVMARMQYNLHMYFRVVNIDYGVGVIDRKKLGRPYNFFGKFNYNDSLAIFREHMLNLITPENFIKEF